MGEERGEETIFDMLEEAEKEAKAILSGQERQRMQSGPPSWHGIIAQLKRMEQTIKQGRELNFRDREMLIDQIHDILKESSDSAYSSLATKEELILLRTFVSFFDLTEKGYQLVQGKKKEMQDWLKENISFLIGLRETFYATQDVDNG